MYLPIISLLHTEHILTRAQIKIAFHGRIIPKDVAY
jgi:hypothetical protein